MAVGRPPKYASDEERKAADAERKRAYREQKRVELEDPALPERQIDEDPAPAAHPSIEKVIAQATPGALSEADEQALRDHFGYADSETRTKAEREEAASKMLGRPSLGISLEQYVATTIAEAAAFADSIGEDDKPHEVIPGVILDNRKTDRIKRAENYARWRYQGVLDGEVGSL